jgi:hypothetical protein
MPPVPSGPWFNAIARHLGRAYWAPGTGRVMAFTKGTEQEKALRAEADQRGFDVIGSPG